MTNLFCVQKHDKPYCVALAARRRPNKTRLNGGGSWMTIYHTSVAISVALGDWNAAKRLSAHPSEDKTDSSIWQQEKPWHLLLAEYFLHATRATQNAAQSATDNGDSTLSAFRTRFKNDGENKGSHSWSNVEQANTGRGGSRTRTGVTPQRILSP